MTDKQPLHLQDVSSPPDTEGEARQVEVIVDALMNAVATRMTELGLRGGVEGAVELRTTVREVVVAGLRRQTYSGVIDALTNSTMQAISKALRQHAYGRLADSANVRAQVKEQVSGICLETGVHDIAKLRALMATAVPRWVAVVLTRRAS